MSVSSTLNEMHHVLEKSTSLDLTLVFCLISMNCSSYKAELFLLSAHMVEENTKFEMTVAYKTFNSRAESSDNMSSM